MNFNLKANWEIQSDDFWPKVIEKDNFNLRRFDDPCEVGEVCGQSLSIT